MKKLSKKQVEEIGFRYGGGKAKSDLILTCSKLRKGEGLLISEKEWKDWGYKSKLAPLIGISCRRERSLLEGRRFRTGKVRGGWAIQRIK